MQDLSIAANSFVNVVDGNSISLNANDKIVLTAETAGTVAALISVDELFDPNRYNGAKKKKIKKACANKTSFVEQS